MKIVICADLHFRDDQPVCRTDDFLEAQIRKMEWLNQLVLNLERTEGCSVPVICAGDYFHHWKPSPRLLTACIRCMPHVYTIAGNHDLPNHNPELLEKSGLKTLEVAKKATILCENESYLFETEKREESVEVISYPFGSEFPSDFTKKNKKGKTIVLAHILINHPSTDRSAESLLNIFNDADLIVTGDNHEQFSVDRLLNPGSFTRQTADQIDSKPAVYIYDSVTSKIRTCRIPIEKDSVTAKHLDVIKSRNDRLDKFTNQLREGKSFELSFEENLKNYLRVNLVRKEVANLVWESVDNEIA